MSKKERYLEYVIYIPFNAVSNNEAQVSMILTYLDYLNLGIKMILAIYKAETKVIEDIFRNTKSKVFIQIRCIIDLIETHNTRIKSTEIS